MGEMLSAGGYVFAIIVLAFVAAVFMFLLRLLEMRRAHVVWEDFFRGVRNSLMQGRLDEALVLCEDAATPVARIAAAGIRHSKASEEVRREAVETAAAAASNRLVRRLAPLALVAQATPLLGLFGTVSGFIRTVTALDAADVLVTRADLLDGVMHALLPAAAGLFTAIVAQVAYSILEGRLGRLVDEFEIAKSETLAAVSAAERAEGSR